MSAAVRSSVRPTSVEPVKDSLRTRGSASIAPTTGPGLRVGSTLTTPSGTPALARMAATASADSGVSLAGLSTTVQPAASAGPIFRVAIAAGKFHGVTRTADPDRLVGDQDPVGPGRGGGDHAVDPHGLFGEPAEELGRVGDLGPGVAQRLAVLQHHQPGQRTRRRRSSARRRGAGTRPGPGVASPPSPESLVGGGDGVERVLGGGVGDLGDRLFGRRVDDFEHACPAGRPLAADQQPGRCVYPGNARQVGRHVRLQELARADPAPPMPDITNGRCHTPPRSGQRWQLAAVNPPGPRPSR